jgi:hypothetical protein
MLSRAKARATYVQTIYPRISRTWGTTTMALTTHFIAVVLGAYIFYVTFVMRESTEGVWTNRIEELWIRVDDHASPDRTKALFNIVADRVARTFTRIVGKKVFSPRIVGVSGSLSLACVSFVYGAFFQFLAWLVIVGSDSIKRHVNANDAAVMMNAVPTFIVLGFQLFGIAAVFGFIALLPVITISPIWAWVSCIPTMLVLLGFGRVAYLRQLTAQEMTLFAALVVSLVSDVLLIIVIRQSLRWMLATFRRKID